MTRILLWSLVGLIAVSSPAQAQTQDSPVVVVEVPLPASTTSTAPEQAPEPGRVGDPPGERLELPADFSLDASGLDTSPGPGALLGALAFALLTLAGTVAVGRLRRDRARAAAVSIGSAELGELHRMVEVGEGSGPDISIEVDDRDTAGRHDVQRHPDRRAPHRDHTFL